jgi:G3E family GTPase
MTGLAVPQDPIPVTLLTGFLGSGKTTVLKNLLKQPEMAGSAVIVNELGEIGLDHALLERSEEDTLLLDGGCLCCALRGDLVATLQSLLERGERGELPAFDQVVIETTGLADPGALIRTFWNDPLRLSRYRFARTVTCIDAVAGARTLERHAEARRQAAFADLLLVTKTDVATNDDARLAATALNRTAPAIEVRNGDLPAGVLLRAAHQGGGADLADGDLAAHHDDIATISVYRPGVLNWSRLERALASLTERYGERLLRLKGLVTIDEFEDLLRVDAVQGRFHRPQAVAPSNRDVDGTRLIAIVQDVEPEVIRSELLSLLDSSAANELQRGLA